jgi:hypothetical protein
MRETTLEELEDRLLKRTRMDRSLVRPPASMVI